MNSGLSRPIRTLFVCDYNAVRSILAECVANRMTGKGFLFESAGIFIAPPDPGITSVLKGRGLFPEQHLPRSIKEVSLREFHHVIALSPIAWDRLLLECTGSKPKLQYWYMPETAFSRPQGGRPVFDPELMLEFLEIKIEHFIDDAMNDSEDIDFSHISSQAIHAH